MPGTVAVESGFAALAGSSELRGQAFEDNSGGRPLELDALKARVEQASV
ncbi:SRPBCC family protein [Streptacidiphilus sp. PAMC 29251]